jgi:hypothetical protein
LNLNIINKEIIMKNPKVLFLVNSLMAIYIGAVSYYLFEEFFLYEFE